MAVKNLNSEGKTMDKEKEITTNNGEITEEQKALME